MDEVFFLSFEYKIVLLYMLLTPIALADDDVGVPGQNPCLILYGGPRSVRGGRQREKLETGTSKVSYP